jgi:hypothetical protein
MEQKEDRVQAINEAQELIYEAIEKIKFAFPRDGNVDAYVIAKLQIIAGEGHGYLTYDTNLDKLRERIENPDEEEEDE